MKFTAALIALTAVSGMVQPLAEPESEFLFTNFVKQYGKKYETSEFFKRYTIFKENLALIRNHNAGNHTYTLGLNEFADMAFTEFKRQMMGKRPDNRAYARSQNSAKLDMVNVPTSVDWTTKGAVTPIKNQGQCGSCWAFSSTGSLEGAYFIKNGNLVSFSEQQLVDCSGSYGNQGCSGGLMDDAFEYIIAKGLCTEASYPYTAQDGTCQASSCTNALASSPVKGYKDVQSDSESALMAAVAQQPVSVAIEADQSVFQFYKSGVMSSSGCGTQLDHGVLVVGYGTSSGQDFWKVKNSWGASWGESGYIRLGRGAGGSGICGLLTEPSYPTM